MTAIQFQFRQQAYRLKFKLGFLVFCAVIIGLCCFLGKWQLHRYHYKQHLLAQYEKNKILPALPFAQWNAENTVQQFQRVAVSGDYVNELTVLLQNRPYKERQGVEVITPLKIAGQKALLLVDRGWIAQDETQRLPAIGPVTSAQQISGEVKLLNEYQFILGKNILDSDAKPIVMQKIDVDELSRVTHQEFYPFILRLSADAPDGFVRDWVISTVQPERHLGYAVQWFAMAFALLIAYFCFCCEKVKSA
jgi:surfeit locus 1 family protein